ncbi:MAG TPA: ammonia channel protein, partial [Pirellulales bacterium]|nr:ammonia channel protein [Pirellulales bacterium]
MSFQRFAILPLLAIAFLACPCAGIARAQAASAGSSADELKALSDKVASASLAGNNAWMLTASALVLLMTAPGLALFYSGLVRKKNVLGVMMQCVFLMGMNSIIWALWGYSLAFGGDPTSKDFSPWIGNGDYLLMHDVQPHWNESAHAAVVPMIDGIPRLTHMIFEGMFFIITPALIC